MRSEVIVLGFALSAAYGAAADAASGNWRTEIISRVQGLSDVALEPASGRVIVHAGNKRYRLFMNGSKPTLAPLPPADGTPSASGIIPHGRVAVGDRDVARAWFAEPTRRYGHGVLGDSIEAAALTLTLRDGRVLTHRLPDNSVFEDLQPRIIALDNEEAVLAVRSYIDAGASIAVFRVVEDRIEGIGESKPIGLPYRWLNPVGAADFDGDGRTEIAAVVTPHLSGRLTLYRRDGARFARVAERRGYATHFMGSTVLAMSAIVDVDGDGVVDIVLPSLDRHRLTAVTFAGGRGRELRSVSHPAAISTSIVMADIDRNGAPDFVYGLENGDLIALRR